MIRDDVYGEISEERERQIEKWSVVHSWGIGDCSSADVPDEVKVMVLTEECGEVARAVLDRKLRDLRTELIQVAAVAVAWLEGMDQ